MKLLLLALTLIAAAPIAVDAQTPAPAPPAAPAPPPEPRSCQRLHEETAKCDNGLRSCDQHVVARLEAQCQRDEKRPPRTGGRP